MDEGSEAVYLALPLRDRMDDIGRQLREADSDSREGLRRELASAFEAYALACREEFLATFPPERRASAEQIMRKFDDLDPAELGMSYGGKPMNSRPSMRRIDWRLGRQTNPKLKAWEDQLIRLRDDPG